jgi:hypothetical protein
MIEFSWLFINIFADNSYLCTGEKGGGVSSMRLVDNMQVKDGRWALIIPSCVYFEQNFIREICSTINLLS